MASHIPSTRLGRALKAGIPVALILLGAELIDGHWRFDTTEQGYTLSWASGDDAMQRSQPAVRVASCLGLACDQWSFAVSLPHGGRAGEALALAQSVSDFVTGDCPEQRSSGRPLAML